VIDRSEVESARFGVDVFRTTVRTAAEAEAAVVFGAPGLLVARVDTSEVALVHVLEHGGFFLTDTLVCFRGTTEGFDQPGRIDGFEIRDVTDPAALEPVARAAFTDFFGHYHTDPRLDGALATEGYVQWCVTALGWSDGYVIGAFDRDALAGFATVRRSGDAAEIVLNGVAPEYQRRGIYSALVQTIGHRARTEGVSLVFSSTQIQNLGPQKTWARHGLLPAESLYTFHRWR
jgi:GNAT superfamily N-acetyltransferase